jgi:hypothetical protein
MLGLARRVGAKILIASTSEVYGDPVIIEIFNSNKKIKHFFCYSIGSSSTS